MCAIQVMFQLQVDKNFKCAILVDALQGSDSVVAVGVCDRGRYPHCYAILQQLVISRSTASSVPAERKPFGRRMMGCDHLIFPCGCWCLDDGTQRLVELELELPYDTKASAAG